MLRAFHCEITFEIEVSDIKKILKLSIQIGMHKMTLIWNVMHVMVLLAL